MRGSRLVAMEFRLSPAKLTAMRGRAASLLRVALVGGTVHTRLLASTIGSFTSCMMAMEVTRLRTRELHRCLAHQVRDTLSYGGRTPLTPLAISELQWGRDSLSSWNGRSLIRPPPTEVFASDASDLGWGMTRLIRAAGEGRDAIGFWTEMEHQLHNNPKELLGIAHGLRAWIQHLDIRDTTVHVQTDNTTALSYIRKQGGRLLELGAVAESLWDWCLNRNIQISASHIAGVLNIRADRLSRTPATPSECRIRDPFFAILVRRAGPFSIDLFADRVNTRLPRYYSRYPDPEAAGTDALLQRWWTEERCYCFPPFALIGRVLQKLELEGGTMLIVVPDWPSQPWWPLLLELSSSSSLDPIPLPHSALDNPARSDALPPSSTRLLAWSLCAPSGRRGVSALTQ